MVETENIKNLPLQYRKVSKAVNIRRTLSSGPDEITDMAQGTIPALKKVEKTLIFTNVSK
jgi:hypothetical protein